MGCNSCNGKGCSQCQTSILNNQSSIIPDPLCQNVCPAIVGCEFPQFSNCVFWTGPILSCSNILPNDNLTVALTKLNSQICAITPNNCTVAISPPSGIITLTTSIPGDNCCDYLWNKIQTVTLSKTVNNPGGSGCLSLEIDDQPWIFTTPVLGGGWTTPTSFPSPISNSIVPSAVRWAVRNSYPTTTNLLEVRFHGQTLSPQITEANPIINALLFTLPVSRTPITPKYFTGYVYGTQGVPVSYSILVNTNGQVIINASVPPCCGGRVTPGLQPYPPTQIIVSFDGLNFIKN